MTCINEKVDVDLSIHASPGKPDQQFGDNNSIQTKKSMREDWHSSSEETAHEADTVEEGCEPKLPAVVGEHDGGYGWVVVCGAFMVQITTFGTISSVMQDYFHKYMLADDPNALLSLSFVGTFAMIFVNACSPIVQVCVARYGVQPVMIVGAICITLALEMASLATQVWHLYLTQGILYGAGSCCMYVIVMTVTPQWFTRRRGIALGIVAGGSGLGGLIFPLIVTPINESLGFAWTYRILGFICLICDIIACFFVKERIPRVKEKKKLSSIIQLNVLKDTNFLIFAIGSDLGLFGYFVPFFFLPAYATYLGLSASQGSNLIAVLSAMNFVGRLVIGYMADYVGKLNTHIIFTLITALSNLLIWTFAFSYASLMGYAIVFGFACGSYSTLMSPISAEILGMEKFPSGMSFLIMSNAIPVFGSNIASAIQSSVATPFLTYKMFTGVSFLVGAIILMILRFRLTKRLFVKI